MRREELALGARPNVVGMGGGGLVRNAEQLRCRRGRVAELIYIFMCDGRRGFFTRGRARLHGDLGRDARERGREGRTLRIILMCLVWRGVAARGAEPADIFRAGQGGTTTCVVQLQGGA